jgi:hypothetical protein
MPFEAITYSLENQVAWITMNRPDARAPSTTRCARLRCSPTRTNLDIRAPSS